MQQYEYRAIPAPTKSAKLKGIKDPAERYAQALSALMNEMALEGWEYWRADVLPCVERKGLTGSVTVYHNLLVFRRLTADALAARMAQAPVAPTPAARTAPAPPVVQPPPDTGSAVPTPSEPPEQPPPEPRAETPSRPLLSRMPEGSAPPLVLRRDEDRPVSAPVDRKDDA